MSEERLVLKSQGAGYGVISEDHHDHGHDHKGHHDPVRHCNHGAEVRHSTTVAERRRLMLAVGLCGLFIVAEVIGGIIANSIAVSTDAAHMIIDMFGYCISLIAVSLSSRTATKSKNFGFFRAEVIGALASMCLIWIMTGVLFYLAVMRCIEQTFDINAPAMLITAGVAIVMNIVLGLILRCGNDSHHGHSHGGGHHGHSHSSKNVNIRAAIIHVVGDFVHSLFVFISALVIFFKPEYKLADPACTFVFSLIVIATTFTISRETLHILMEGIPPGIEFDDVKKALLEQPGVVRVHNMRIWALTAGRSAMVAHLVTAGTSDWDALLRASSDMLTIRFGIAETTIQIEPFVEDMDNCANCMDPRS